MTAGERVRKWTGYRYTCLDVQLEEIALGLQVMEKMDGKKPRFLVWNIGSVVVQFAHI